ncbi:MAG: hypothetical protein KKB70_10120 [Proteobacteria bacterium]|nr:hypothetical protein [Pseudomonadota bacterium]MBU1612048.1 hypothetical protein [Pseudomonadota bacterium]
MRRLVATTILTLVTVACLAGTAHAGRRVLFTPSLHLGATYNDDVQYLGKGDMEFTANPRLKLEIDSERTQHTITANLTRYKYGDIAELDRTETDITLDTIYAATERLTLSSNVSYSTDYTLGKSEEELGIVADKVRRGSLSLGGRAAYMLTERTQVGLSFNHFDRQYAEEYVDSSGNTLSGDISWAATERLTLLGSLTTSEYDSQFNDGGTGNFNSYGGSVGFDYQLTEIWGLTGSYGHQWYTNKLDTGGIDRTISEDGSTFELGVDWEYERSKGHLKYGRDTTSGLTGSTLDRDRLEFYHQYETTERSLLELRASMTQTESDGVLSTSKSRNLNYGASWWYDMTEDHRFWIGWSHSTNENLINNKDRDRNSYFVRFDFTFPDEWTLGGAR